MERKNLKRRLVLRGISLAENIPDKRNLKIVLNKALGILRINGLYGFFIWLGERGSEGKEEKKIARAICQECFNLLFIDELSFFKNKVNNLSLKTCNDDIEKIENWIRLSDSINNILIKENLFTIDELFFLGQLYEQMLTYALYSAKANDLQG
ncbi:MAG: hypothetical protein KAX49_08275 [Halanaerobiales bacterium]|nr:hypothetical protein [Halanaerobiales bacterium]